MLDRRALAPVDAMAGLRHAALRVSSLSDTQYARSGDLFIAYRVAGTGPTDVLLAPGYLSHVEQNFEWPPYAAFIDALASFARVIVFDRRGSGLSDRLRDNGNFDEVMEDISAVLDAVGSKRAAMIGVLDGGPVCSVYAAAHPERCSALILFGSYARGTRAPDYEFAPSEEEHEETLRRYELAFGRRPFAARVVAPGLADDPQFLRWLLRAQRYGASPGAAMDWYRMTAALDIREVLPTIRVPTLVMHRTERRAPASAAAEHLAANIPGARLVGLPGADPLGTGPQWRSDAAEIERFLTGSQKTLTADRVLATVLFTDIVGSTGHATRLGDERWREVLARHDLIVRRLLDDHGGREVNTTGDGFLATFDRPGAAIRCATAIRDEVSEAGVEVRAALHAGEVEVRGSDIGGIAVHIASRILGLAGPGEVLLSRTVRDLVAGSGLAVVDRGEHSLKDLQEPWRLYVVES
jgi:class 3 adenylate cyclase